jgi:hypothetical protein
LETYVRDEGKSVAELLALAAEDYAEHQKLLKKQSLELDIESLLIDNEPEED